MSTLTIPASLRAEFKLRERTQWRAYHIFYGGSPLIILRDCILPLAQKLQDEGQIVDYFFINYWLEGSHVRFRLRVEPEKVSDVDAIVLSQIRDYLDHHPSYHPMAELTDNSFYETLFAGEFDEADRPMYFDADGEPRFAPNNSIQVRDYDPEWLRYGGPIGMLISERYFVDSTRLMYGVAALGNMGVRTILLGLATQITFITAVCLLRDVDRIEAFFAAYHERWAAGYDENPVYVTEQGRKAHNITVEKIRGKILPRMQEILASDVDDVPEILREWVSTCMRVRQQIEDACAASSLQFSYDGGVRDVSDPDDAAWSLCHSFVHMTNNRLMVSVADEAFLAYHIVEAMRRNKHDGN